MTRRQKNMRPFFALRFEITDTLEAVSREILMSLQAMEAAIQLGSVNEAGRKILQERVDGLRRVCMSEEA